MYIEERVVDIPGWLK